MSWRKCTSCGTDLPVEVVEGREVPALTYAMLEQVFMLMHDEKPPRGDFCIDCWDLEQKWQKVRIVDE